MERLPDLGRHPRERLGQIASIARGHRLDHVVGDIEQRCIAVLCREVVFGEHQTAKCILIEQAACSDIGGGVDRMDDPRNLDAPVCHADAS